MADEQVRLIFSITEEDLFQYFLYHRLSKKPIRYVMRGWLPFWVGATTLWVGLSSQRDGVLY
jgi:hypothetical protein